MKWTCLAALAALAGCAFPSTAGMNTGLPKLMGRDVRAAIDVLGYPTKKVEVAGDTVYDWYIERGTVLAVAPGAYVPSQVSCWVQLVERDGKLAKWNWSGTPGMCSYYSGKLDAWMKTQG